MGRHHLKLFTGSACFSPAVDRADLLSWAALGGVIARSEEKRRSARYYFCNGLDDPWVNILKDKLLVVFDASWIAQAVKERFCVPMSPYVLDDHAAPLPTGRVVEGRKAAQSAAATTPSLQRVSASRSVSEVHEPEMHTRPGRSKRQIDHMDSPDSGPRPLKRTRLNTPPLAVANEAIKTDRSPGHLASEHQSYRQEDVKRTTEPPMDNNILRLDLAAIKKPTRLSKPSNLRVIPSIAKAVAADKSIAPNPEPGFFEMMYSKTPDAFQSPRPLRFAVSNVMKALEGVSTAETCVFERATRHLGEEFHVWSTDSRASSHVPHPRPMTF